MIAQCSASCPLSAPSVWQLHAAPLALFSSTCPVHCHPQIFLQFVFTILFPWSKPISAASDPNFQLPLKVLCTLVLPHLIFTGIPPAHLLLLLSSTSLNLWCAQCPLVLFLLCRLAFSPSPVLAPYDSPFPVHLGRTPLSADFPDYILWQISP